MQLSQALALVEQASDLYDAAKSALVGQANMTATAWKQRRELSGLEDYLDELAECQAEYDRAWNAYAEATAQLAVLRDSSRGLVPKPGARV